jgi:hypothetical protein
MRKPSLIFSLACVLLAGCLPSSDEQASAQTGAAPNATAAPLPAASAVAWEPKLVTTDELKAKLDAKEALTVYDVRAQESWETEHITGSKSLPWAKLEERKQALSRTTPIVLYCA